MSYDPNKYIYDPNKYSYDDYTADRNSSDIIHTKDKIRFRDFYEALARDPAQHKQQYQSFRTDWIRPIGSIIEPGCHIGFNCIHYGRLGHYCVGIDVSQGLIDLANDALAKESDEVRSRVQFIQGYIEDISLPMKFNTVLLTETLEHVIDPIPIMLKCREFITDNGMLFITAPSIKTGNNSHIRGISEEYAMELANLSDFDIVLFARGIKDQTCFIAMPKGANHSIIGELYGK